MSCKKWRKRTTAGSTWRTSKSHLSARVSGDDADDSDELQLSPRRANYDAGRNRVFLRRNPGNSD